MNKIKISGSTHHLQSGPKWYLSAGTFYEEKMYLGLSCTAASCGKEDVSHG